MTDQVRRIGYISTSPTDQQPNVQNDALKEAELTELHEANGQVDQRQALKEILDLLGDGDALIVYRMDRVARDEHSDENFKQQLGTLGVKLVTSDENGENNAK